MAKFYFGCILTFFTFIHVIGLVTSGTIVDASGIVISGAYITHLRSESHTHSNQFGKFSFNRILLGDTLEVRQAFGYGFWTPISNKRLVVC